MEFTDTHCHIHEASVSAKGDEFVRDKWVAAGITDPLALIQEAAQAGVTRLLCVGCTLKDSQLAVELVQNEPMCWASVGIHPHEAKDHTDKTSQDTFAELVKQPRVVAIGECGLDFYYNHSSRADQIALLRFQLQLAQQHSLPLIFHVRDAFSDFWPVYDEFEGIKGVVHSFSTNQAELDQILSRGLYVGLNGIMTFTKNPEQLLAAKAIPLQNLLLETDAPFLTPAPYRGTICKPKHVVQTAEFLAGLRDESLAALARATTQNACNLFGLE
ncbi:MAG TPA: TatD family hydrolase [Candidatus Limnocylindrales bacterium]|nr:TatD family hydrolase [Candidatus Limnocylindrales bacterium]